MKNETEQSSRIDYGIVLCVMLLAIIGLLSLYSTTVLIQGESIRSTIMQGVWYILGIGAAGVIMLFDSEQLWKLTNILYWIG
ncbi:MAG TPA: rod shape-determining protein RodA, partial [Atopostipes sp.]|nr:rod shape-determining protein RodA [Atopostipes sp.]